MSDCAILTVMAEPPKRSDPLKSAGFMLLLMGWILVLAAIVLLSRQAARSGFALAGFGVEVLGLALVARSYIAPKPERH
jgi:hypothetical protein